MRCWAAAGRRCCWACSGGPRGSGSGRCRRPSAEPRCWRARAGHSACCGARRTWATARSPAGPARRWRAGGAPRSSCRPSTPTAGSACWTRSGCGRGRCATSPRWVSAWPGRAGGRAAGSLAAQRGQSPRAAELENAPCEVGERLCCPEKGVRARDQPGSVRRSARSSAFGCEGLSQPSKSWGCGRSGSPHPGLSSVCKEDERERGQTGQSSACCQRVPVTRLLLSMCRGLPLWPGRITKSPLSSGAAWQASLLFCLALLPLLHPWAWAYPGCPRVRTSGREHRN